MLQIVPHLFRRRRPALDLEPARTEGFGRCRAHGGFLTGDRAGTDKALEGVDGLRFVLIHRFVNPISEAHSYPQKALTAKTRRRQDDNSCGPWRLGALGGETLLE